VSADELRQLAADLARYLRQQQERGPQWLLVEPPAPAAAAGPDVDARRAREEAFQRECAAFVQESLAAIVRTRQAPPPPLATLDPEQKPAALAALAQEVAPCTLCKLHGGRIQTVFGAGDANADLVLIGEAPGRDEDEQGLPFVGRSGQLLTQILQAIGLARDEVFICNILKCRPPQNRDPQPDEVAACEPYLQRQLAILEPRVILCLGRVAAQTLLGTKASLGSLRRTVHFYQSIPVMVTYHPAAVLRDATHKRPTWDDVRKVRALLEALRAAPG
jgi:uracil-DNA glycosylase